MRIKRSASHFTYIFAAPRTTLQRQQVPFQGILFETFASSVGFWAAFSCYVLQGHQQEPREMDLYSVNLFLLMCYVSLAETGEECPKTTTLKNGHVRFQSRGGVTAVFSCDSGFILRGSNVSHCQTDGHWSAPAPSCVPQDQRCATSGIEIATLYPGKSINITCSANTTDENVNVFWTTNGSVAKNAHNINGTVVLSANSQGTYICLFYNESTASVLRAVKVKYSHEKSLRLRSDSCQIAFKDTTSTITTAVGSQISISCDTGSSTTQITWFKNGEPVYDKNISHSRTYLNFSNIIHGDGGNYTCFVREENAPDCSATKSVVVKVQNPIFLLPSNSCGQPVVRRSKRVIDGSRAAPLSAPWMCMLSLDREPPFCGCSLISSRWIITAAHCFKITDQGSSKMMSQEEIRKKIRVKFGKQQRRQVEKGEIVRGIQNMVAYPKYKPNSSSQNIASEHDIALAKLDVPVTFQSNILPICLPPPGFVESVPTGTLGIVTGWGRVSVRDSVMALTLQEAYLPLVNSNSCQRSTDYVITDNMLCAGYAESYRPDTCFGDSGGPYILQKENSWFLAGIVSWGEGCSSPRKFGIYTKVENYVPWIHSVWELESNA